MNEKPPYYMIWMLSLFTIVLLIVIIIAMGQKKAEAESSHFVEMAGIANELVEEHM